APSNMTPLSPRSTLRRNPARASKSFSKRLAFWSERLRRDREAAPRAPARQLRLRQGRSEPLSEAPGMEQPAGAQRADLRPRQGSARSRILQSGRRGGNP